MLLLATNPKARTDCTDSPLAKARGALRYGYVLVYISRTSIFQASQVVQNHVNSSRRTVTLGYSVKSKSLGKVDTPDLDLR